MEKRPRILSVWNLKGGVGKTYTATNIAAELSHRYQYHVLLVDNDKQGNLSRRFNCYKPDMLSGTAQMLTHGAAAPEIVHTGTGIDIIPANMSLMGATWQTIAEGSADSADRYLSLRKLADYDYIIIDNPPDIAINVIDALVASHYVIVPVKIDSWSLEGYDNVIELIGQAQQINTELRLLGTVATQYHRSYVSDNSGMKWLQEHTNVLGTIRYSSKAVENTFSECISARDYSARSAVAIDYKKLVPHILAAMNIAERQAR